MPIGSHKLKVVVTESDIDVPQLRKIANVYQHGAVGAMPREELLSEVVNAEGLLCLLRDRIDRELLDRAPNLKVISTMSVGYEHIDVNECRKRNIRIGYTPDVLTEATAELAMALLLATSRRICEAVDVAKSGGAVWTPSFMCGRGIRNSAVGIYGLGAIGRSFAEKALAFHPKCIIYHNRRKRDDLPADVFEYVTFTELLARSDFLIICAKPSADNCAIFDRIAFAAMRRDAILVNVSRGSLVQHDDLLVALRDGEIRAAGLDVTVPEPLPADSSLFRLPNCVILPHIGSATTETREAMRSLAEQNLVNHFAGQPMPAELLAD